MSDGLDQVRRAVAVEHGLDEAAAAFLQGDTLDAIESSANRFVELVGKRDTPGHGPTGDLFADAARAKAARKQAILNTVAGRQPAQPRDEQGRYARNFDGGARPGNAPRDPEPHGRWLGRVLASREADTGGTGF